MEEQQQACGWRYQPSYGHIHVGDAVAIVYYSHIRGHWRLHDGIYLGGPHLVIDNGQRPKAGPKASPYLVGHYRLRLGTGNLCHEVLKISMPLRIIKTAHLPYPADNPTVKPHHQPCGPGNTIGKGRAVAIKIPGDAKNGLLLHDTCISFPNHDGWVAINHLKLRGGEAAWKNRHQPPGNHDIIGASHTYGHVSFVKAATLSLTTDC